MAAAALVAVGVLALLVFVLSVAVAELLRDVRQMRDALGILDRPIVVDIAAAEGKAPSALGLDPRIDRLPAALVVILSDKCATCRVLAGSLGGTLPAGVWLLIESATPAAAEEFVAMFGFAPLLREGRVAIDAGGAVAERLGLNVSPVGIRIENGQVRAADTIPSIRHLTSILPQPAEEPIAAPTAGRTLLRALFSAGTRSG